MGPSSDEACAHSSVKIKYLTTLMRNKPGQWVEFVPTLFWAWEAIELKGTVRLLPSFQANGTPALRHECPRLSSNRAVPLCYNANVKAQQSWHSSDSLHLWKSESKVFNCGLSSCGSSHIFWPPKAEANITNLVLNVFTYLCLCILGSLVSPPGGYDVATETVRFFSLMPILWT